jgi:hypothetical protein
VDASYAENKFLLFGIQKTYLFPHFSSLELICGDFFWGKKKTNYDLSRKVYIFLTRMFYRQWGGAMPLDHSVTWLGI